MSNKCGCTIQTQRNPLLLCHHNECPHKGQAFKVEPSEGGEYHKVEDAAGRLAYTGPKGAAEAIAKFLNDPATPHREGMALWIIRNHPNP